MLNSIFPMKEIIWINLRNSQPYQYPKGSRISLIKFFELLLCKQCDLRSNTFKEQMNNASFLCSSNLVSCLANSKLTVCNFYAYQESAEEIIEETGSILLENQEFLVLVDTWWKILAWSIAVLILSCLCCYFSRFVQSLNFKLCIQL